MEFPIVGEVDCCVLSDHLKCVFSINLAGERVCVGAPCLLVWKSVLCRWRIFDSSSVVALADIPEGCLSKPAIVWTVVASLSDAALLWHASKRSSDSGML